MPAPNPSKQSRIIPAFLLGGGSWLVLDYYGYPPQVWFYHPVTGAAAVLFAAAALTASADILKLFARFIGWRAANKPKGLKGTASFIKSLRELRGELCEGWGPFFGAYKGAPIIADFESSALIVGPSGSGKNVCSYQPCAMAMPHVSKAFIDFRSNQTPVLLKPLKARGERIAVFNLGGVNAEHIPGSTLYNPTCVIADDFWRAGGLLDIVEHASGMCLWLYPDPGGEGGKNDNQYFRDGSRTLILVALFLCVLVKGNKATLGDVLALLNDRQRFLKECQWAAGRLSQAGSDEPAEMPIWESPWVGVHDPTDVQCFIDWFRGQASGVADLLESPDDRTYQSFVTGAQQALFVFNDTTHAARIFQNSEFRFGSMKDGKRPTTVFFCIDPNKIVTQSRILGLLTYCMLVELRRHPDKQRPVYIFADEVSNIEWPGLGSLITWARSYSTRFFFYLQNFPAFAAAHSEETLRTLQSECEIQIFLPNQREPDTLAYLEQKLGSASIVVKGNRANTESGPFALDGFDLREEGRALLDKDEIRRLDGKGLLFIRNKKPLLVDLPSIAEISPWRKKMGIDPFFGKKFLKPIRLRIKWRGGFWGR